MAKRTGFFVCFFEFSHGDFFPLNLSLVVSRVKNLQWVCVKKRQVSIFFSAFYRGNNLIFITLVCVHITLPETNSSPLKIDPWKRIPPFLGDMLVLGSVFVFFLGGKRRLSFSFA